MAKGLPWTRNERMCLMRDYGTVPISELSASLGRTKAAVKSMYHKLRLLQKRGKCPEISLEEVFKGWERL